MNFTMTTLEGQWTGWPNVQITPPGIDSTGAKTFDWTQVTNQMYVPSYYGVTISPDGKIHALDAGGIESGDAVENNPDVTFDPNGSDGNRGTTFSCGNRKSMAVDKNGSMFFPSIDKNIIIKWADKSNGDGCAPGYAWQTFNSDFTQSYTDFIFQIPVTIEFKNSKMTKRDRVLTVQLMLLCGEVLGRATDNSTIQTAWPSVEIAFMLLILATIEFKFSIWMVLFTNLGVV
jgi:hypothetical protein